MAWIRYLYKVLAFTDLRLYWLFAWDAWAHRQQSSKRGSHESWCISQHNFQARVHKPDLNNRVIQFLVHARSNATLVNQNYRLKKSWRRLGAGRERQTAAHTLHSADNASDKKLQALQPTGNWLAPASHFQKFLTCTCRQFFSRFWSRKCRLLNSFTTHLLPNQSSVIAWHGMTKLVKWVAVVAVTTYVYRRNEYDQFLFSLFLHLALMLKITPYCHTVYSKQSSHLSYS